MGIHVSLPAEMEAMVHEKVKTGMYGSASEVIREALRGFFSADQKKEDRIIPELSNAQLEKFLEPIIAQHEASPDPGWMTFEEFEASLDRTIENLTNRQQI